MRLQVKLTRGENLITNNDFDSGYDLMVKGYSRIVNKEKQPEVWLEDKENFMIHPNETILLKTGIHLGLPEPIEIYKDVYKIIGLKKDRKNKLIISYSRVSTGIQTKQLKSQTNRIYEFCTSKGISLNLQLEDIKSGMNFERKSFQQLIELVIKGEVELIVIENRDRLVRFGFELIELIFRYFGTKILVINDIENKDYEKELTEDLVSIIHYFSMKMYSHRRKLNKIKMEIIKKL